MLNRLTRVEGRPAHIELLLVVLPLECKEHILQFAPNSDDLSSRDEHWWGLTRKPVSVAKANIFKVESKLRGTEPWERGGFWGGGQGVGGYRGDQENVRPWITFSQLKKEKEKFEEEVKG